MKTDEKNNQHSDKNFLEKVFLTHKKLITEIKRWIIKHFNDFE
jgi:hypothetical protein